MKKLNEAETRVWLIQQKKKTKYGDAWDNLERKSGPMFYFIRLNWTKM